MLLAPLVPAGHASALEIPAGSPELVLRLDNTIRYNFGLRTDPVSPKIGANPAFTEGENSVPQGGLATHRLDLLSELDLAWRARWGARLSTAAWYDAAYQGGRATMSPALAAAGIPGSYLGGAYSRYTLRRYRGPWGEVLDAFVFARLDAGEVPVTFKAGRHTVYWGESLMQAGATHGVCYGQMPLDLQKAFATPGVEAKELFRPLASVSGQAQLTPSLSLSAQAFLQWQSNVYPEGGTYLGPADFAFNGPDGIFRNLSGTPAFLRNDGVSRPGDLGEWGVALRWQPAWLDGTVGLYYRRFTDKLAAVLLTANPGGVGPLSPAIASPFRYRQYYGEGIQLVGLSLARQLLGASLGAELSYRRDMPLLAQSLGFAVAPAPPLQAVLFPHGPPTLRGNSYQARGDTWHGVLNAVGVVGGGPVFSSASWALEVTGSRWLAVRDNQDLFYGLGHGVCRTDPALAAAGLARGKADGCATRGHLGVGAALAPTWFRAFPSVDLSLPLALSWSVAGNSPVTLGGNQGSGTWSAGVGADLDNRFRLDLKYVDFFGATKDNGTMVTSANGLLALLKNRGSVTLTAKTTF
jgi:hypothetical protein